MLSTSFLILEKIFLTGIVQLLLKDLAVFFFTKQGSLRILYPKEELFITLCRRMQRLLEEHSAHLCRVSQNPLLFIRDSVY